LLTGRLALDERRSPFPPALWARDLTENEPTKNDHTRLKQVWFAGCHSTIGGGEHGQDLSDISLVWMVQQVLSYTNLKIDKAALQLKGGKTWRGTPWGCGQYEESYAGFYYIAGKEDREPKSHKFRRFRGGPVVETVETSEELHTSLRKRLDMAAEKPLDGKYRPYAFRTTKITYGVYFSKVISLLI
jgi:hypothetical protein